MIRVTESNLGEILEQGVGDSILGGKHLDGNIMAGFTIDYESNFGLRPTWDDLETFGFRCLTQAFGYGNGWGDKGERDKKDNQTMFEYVKAFLGNSEIYLFKDAFEFAAWIMEDTA